MSKQPLAIVCALAFVVGGASAFLLELPPRGFAGVQDVTERGAVVDSGAAAESEAAESTPEELARPEEASVESTQKTGEAARANKTFVGAKVSGPSDGRAREGGRATRGYARVQSGGAASGGRGIAGYTVGGVKKTGGGMKKAGAAIGKTFGKVGGLFHD